MEVREGYKKTEFGVIPHIWKCCTVEEILEKSSVSIKIGPFGSQLKKELISNNGDYRVYGQENVYDNNFEIGERYLSKERFLQLQSCEIKYGDILISMMGTIGKCVIVPEKFLRGIMDSHLIRLRVDKNNVMRVYIKYLIAESSVIKQQLVKLSVGGIMSGLSSGIIKQLLFPIPPLSEQHAITTALSDMDGLISSLKKLIDKKKNIKQGVMQELLTSKRRLDGFSGDWGTDKFRNITKVITCGMAATPTYINSNVGVPFLSSTNIKNGKVRWDNFKHIHIDLHKRLYKNNPPLGGDILYSRVGTIGEAAVIPFNKEFSIYVSLTLIKLCEYMNSKFVAQLLNSNKYKRLAMQEVFLGGGVGNLNVNVVREFDIPIPSYEEQTAIANVLSELDTEIEELEKKLNKYKAIKQGMMQELLTGRIRLVEAMH